MSLLAIAALLSVAGVAQDAPPDEKIRAWVEQLGALYETERQEARKQLAAVGAAAEKRLVGGLDHADHRVRRGCLELLALINAPSGVDRAAALFRSKNEDRAVHAAAFEYLKKHAAKAEEFFIETLGHVEESYRQGSVETLTGIRSTKSLEKAAALFERETVKAIKDRIFELLKAGGEPSRPHLLKLMGNSDASVRQEALDTLVDMETPPDDLVEPVAQMLKMETPQSLLDKAFEVYGRAIEKAKPHLLQGLRSPSQSVRLKSLEFVAQKGVDGALEAVGEMYQRESVEQIRQQARGYLVEQGLRAEPAFIKALDSSIPDVRVDAIEALGKIKSEKVFDRVALLYKNEKNPKVRGACFAYLETVGLRAEEELLVALKDEDIALRRRAIRALGQAGSLKAIAPLMEFLKDAKADIRGEVVEALAWIGAKAVEQLQEGVKAKRVSEQDATDVNALYNQVAVERILDAMITENGTTGTWPGQFEGLAKLGRDRVLPVLWKITNEAEYAVRARNPQDLPPPYHESLQTLALLAIGELGDATSLKNLKALTFTPGEDRHLEQLVALHRLGEKAPLADFVASELKEGRVLLTGEQRKDGYRKILNAAVLQARAGLREEALKSYVELTSAVEKAKEEQDFPAVALAHYNIACLHATAGRKAEAVTSLARAVETGFRDFEWIFKDKDLDSIRGEEGYKKLTEEAEKTRKK